jgi:hypothetical protein
MRAREFITGTKQFLPSNTITTESIIDFITKSASTMNNKHRVSIIEHMSKNSGSLLNEVLDMELVNNIQKQLSSFAVKNAVIGEKYIPVSIDVYNDQIIVYDVIRNSPPEVKATFGVLVGENENGYVMKMDKDMFIYPITLSSVSKYVVMLSGLFDTVENYEKFRTIMSLIYDKKFPPVDMKSVSESASGYIPSKKQANDPRYKTSLTTDVKPDTIQKNAKKLGSKISRAGIPPLLRK